MPTLSSSATGPSSPATTTKSTNYTESLRHSRVLASKLYFDVPLSKVHSESYLNSLKSSLIVSIIIEVGGTILAAKLGKERGWAINVGGGFHHCSAVNGGGFRAYADISLCNHHTFIRLNISRVYILDMYNPEIYPFDYEARRCIDQKVEVVSETSTDDYLIKLDEALKVAGRMFDPELVIYNAGTDILDGDTLSRLKISPDAITSQDEKISRFARERNIPLVMITSGGYMKSSAKVIIDSIVDLSKKCLIDMGVPQGKYKFPVLHQVVSLYA